MSPATPTYTPSPADEWGCGVRVETGARLLSTLTLLSPLASDVPAAVDLERRARPPERLVRRQVERRPRDILGLIQAPERDRREVPVQRITRIAALVDALQHWRV